MILDPVILSQILAKFEIQLKYGAVPQLYWSYTNEKELIMNVKSTLEF